MQNIEDKVKQTLAQILNITDSAKITKEKKLREDLGLDSMSSLTFLIALEESIDGFNVDPDTLTTAHLETVQSITQYIEQHLAA